MAAILITRPNHDQITNYLSQWSETVISFAKSKGRLVFDLFSNRADRKSFEQYLESKQIDFLFLNGHGSSEVICGFKDEVLLDEITDPSIIRGQIIFARSCNAGELLGHILVDKGVKTFIGYSKSFSIAINNHYVYRPKDDPLAKLFIDPSNLIATTIIKGNTVQEANHRSLLEMRKTLSEMISSNIPNKKDYAFALYNNMIGQVVIGDDQAKI
jgi:hypothetical protein